MTSARPTAVGHEPAVAAGGSPPVTILVVDDERPIREMLALAFERSGYRVMQAFHGRHAAEIIARERPNLVISDVMMPLVDGVELCRRLKANSTTASVPVILMSAAGPHAGREAGADAVVVKPFDLDDMDILVEQLLHSARE